MSNWKEYVIGDLAQILSSKRIFASDYINSGIPFYRSKEIIQKSMGQTVTTELFISQKLFNSIKNKYGSPQKGDILISAIGRPGIPYYVSDEKDFYFKDGNLIWFRNFDKCLLSKFLYYYLKSPVGQSKLESITIGSVQKALTIIEIKGLVLNLPPLPEQKAIASILSSLDDKIELNQQQQQKQRQQRQTQQQR